MRSQYKTVKCTYSTCTVATRTCTYLLGSRIPSPSLKIVHLSFSGLSRILVQYRCSIPLMWLTFTVFRLVTKSSMYCTINTCIRRYRTYRYIRVDYEYRNVDCRSAGTASTSTVQVQVRIATCTSTSTLQVLYMLVLSSLTVLYTVGSNVRAGDTSTIIEHVLYEYRYVRTGTVYTRTGSVYL